MAGRRRRWAARRERGGMTLWTSSCDPSATSSAVLFPSSGVVPLLQFIVRVDSVRDGVLLMLSSVVNRVGADFAWLHVVLLRVARCPRSVGAESFV